MLLIIYRRKITWIQRINQAEDQTQLPRQLKTKKNPRVLTRTKKQVEEAITVGEEDRIRRIGEGRMAPDFELLSRKFP